MLDSIEEDEIILIAHSWGCVIFYDYLKEIGDSRVKKLITMGCPIPLDRGEDYTNLEGVDWVNYWEYNDPIAHKMFREGIDDRRYKSWNVFKSWNPLAHISYLKSRSLSRKIKKEIS